DRARDYTRSAREGFIFDPALISAERNLFRPAFLDKIYVCAFWRKHFVMTNGSAFSPHIDLVDVQDRDDYMRYPAVDEVNGLVFILEVKPDVQPQISRFSHIQRDEIVSCAIHFCKTQHPISFSILRRDSQPPLPVASLAFTYSA